MTRLHDYDCKAHEPIQGTKVKVRLGGGIGNTVRTVEGEITRSTTRQVYVRYTPHERAVRPQEERFWKKDGSRVGDGKFPYGPRIDLAD